MPRRDFTWGRKFSTTTSALAARRRKTSTPSGDFRSSVRLRLLRCRFWKSGPWRGPPAGSPSSLCPGSSILMTLAPQSANWRTQVGPARTRVRSRTVKRSSAAEAFGRDIPRTLSIVADGQQQHRDVREPDAAATPLDRGRNRAVQAGSELRREERMVGMGFEEIDVLPARVGRRPGKQADVDRPEGAAPFDLTGELSPLRFDRVASRRGRGREPARVGGVELGAQRGIETGRLVADERQPAAGTERRSGLYIADGRVDPVKGLGGDHQIERSIGAAPRLERHLLNGDLGKLRDVPAEDRGHVLARLQRHHRVATARKQQGGLARPRADLENSTGRGNLAPGDDLVDQGAGVRRTRGVIQLRLAVE